MLLIYAYLITFCTKILSHRGLVMTNSIELKNKLKTKYNSVKIVYSSTIRNNELINIGSKKFHNPIRLYIQEESMMQRELMILFKLYIF